MRLTWGERRGLKKLKKDPIEGEQFRNMIKEGKLLGETEEEVYKKYLREKETSEIENEKESTEMEKYRERNKVLGEEDLVKSIINDREIDDEEKYHRLVAVKAVFKSKYAMEKLLMIDISSIKAEKRQKERVESNWDKLQKTIRKNKEPLSKKLECEIEIEAISIIGDTHLSEIEKIKELYRLYYDFRCDYVMEKIKTIDHDTIVNHYIQMYKNEYDFKKEIEENPDIKVTLRTNYIQELFFDKERTGRFFDADEMYDIAFDNEYRTFMWKTYQREAKKLFEASET